MKLVKIYCGKLCSGKGWVIEDELKYDCDSVVRVSSIIKKFTKYQNRSDLQKTAYLDDYVYNQLIKNINNHCKLMIDGIRQPSILYKIIEYCNKHNIQYQLIWVYASEDIRRKRFSLRNEEQSFEQANQGDYNLGINEIEQFINKNGIVLNNNKDIDYG
ncbi:MAG: hypothetical protein ACOCQD_02500 [archaeon]